MFDVIYGKYTPLEPLGTHRCLHYQNYFQCKQATFIGHN